MGSNCIPEWQEGHGHWERWPLEDLFNTSADAVWLAEEGNEPDDDKDLFDYRDDPRLVRIELVKDGILPGQVREFTGPDGEKSLGLIFRLFEPGVDQKDSIYMVCPIKPLSEEDPTGVCVLAQGDRETLFQVAFGVRGSSDWFAMPHLGGSKDGYLISDTPVIGTVIPETLQQVWELYRWPITGIKPDPEKDFHYFENPYSREDWELSRVVLFDPDFLDKVDTYDWETGKLIHAAGEPWDDEEDNEDKENT